jgi:hypothetical protein
MEETVQLLSERDLSPVLGYGIGRGIRRALNRLKLIFKS